MGLAVTLAACVSLTATTIPYPNPGKIAPTQSFVATTSSDVTAYFYGSNAGYDEQLGLFVNGQQLGGWSLDDHKSTFGESVDFGHVAAGSTLVFAIDVLSTKTIIYSDPAMNGDKDNHTYATAFGGLTKNGVTIPSGTYIGFEDLLAPHSDFNYTDEQFILGDTTASLTPGGTSLSPEPNSVISIGFGIVCIAIGSFRRRGMQVLKGTQSEQH